MNGVVANNNGDYGVYIENYDGLGYVPVTVNNGTFNENGLAGLRVDVNGPITVSNALAYGNGAEGFNLDNIDAASRQPVKLTNVTAMENVFRGISVITVGAVTASKIEVDSK